MGGTSDNIVHAIDEHKWRAYTEIKDGKQRRFRAKTKREKSKHGFFIPCVVRSGPPGCVLSKTDLNHRRQPVEGMDGTVAPALHPPDP